MKTLFAALFGLLVASAAAAQPLYVNTNGGFIIPPGAVTPNLPTMFTTASGILYNPSQSDYITAGWRLVNSAQSPTAGNAVDTYFVSITNSVLGKCNLLVATQHSIQQAIDASITNAPTWTVGLITAAQQFRSILVGYVGAGAETNINITDQVAVNFFVNRYKAGTLTTNDLMNLAIVQIILPNLQTVSSNTTQFPWRFVP